jgi:hypothetical protein
MTSQSWMTTENMESIWSHFEEGNGVVEIFSISTNLNWSTLPLKGNFVPFIHNLIYQSMHLNLSSLYVGEKWKLDGNKLIGTNTIHYASPGNPAVKKFVPQDLMLQPSDAIGFHSILRDSRTVSQVAFNAAFDELNSPLLSYDEIDKLVKLPINHIDASEEITTHIKLAQTGTELWRIFLIILILLIVTEMLISNYGNHQKSK